MDWFNKPYRFRSCWIVIKLAVILHIFVSSYDAKTIIYYVFRMRVSPKTICQWTKKFSVEIPQKVIFYDFGRKCKSIVTGIKIRPAMIGKKLYWLNNNPAESLNAEIDAYLSKFRYSFENLESANRSALQFVTRKDLREACN